MNTKPTAAEQDHLDGGDRVEEIREMARDQYEDEGTLEIDDGAVVSEGGDNGAYVAAWVWVSFYETKFDKEKEGNEN